MFNMYVLYYLQNAPQKASAPPDYPFETSWNIDSNMWGLQINAKYRDF